MDEKTRRDIVFGFAGMVLLIIIAALAIGFGVYWWLS